MTSPPEELCERLRGLERAGVRQVAFIPPRGEFEMFLREFSEKVIARM